MCFQGLSFKGENVLFLHIISIINQSIVLSNALFKVWQFVQIHKIQTFSFHLIPHLCLKYDFEIWGAMSTLAWNCPLRTLSMALYWALYKSQNSCQNLGKEKNRSSKTRTLFIFIYEDAMSVFMMIICLCRRSLFTDQRLYCHYNYKYKHDKSWCTTIITSNTSFGFEFEFIYFCFCLFFDVDFIKLNIFMDNLFSFKLSKTCS